MPYLQCIQGISHATLVMDPNAGGCSHQKHDYTHCMQREGAFDINAPVLRATNNHPGEAARLGVSGTFQGEFYPGVTGLSLSKVL